MNGFTAADMSTAAASGFCDGLAAQPVAAQEAVRKPDGYHYRYPTLYGTGTYIRHNNGEEVNGSKPIEAVPYWYAPVAEAPVDAVNYAKLYGMACEAADFAGLELRLDGDKDVLNLLPKASAPAAPVDPSLTLHDRVEFALRDAGFDLDEAAFVSEAAAAANESTPAAPVVDQSRLGAAMTAFDAAGGHAVRYAPEWMRKALEAASTPAAPGIDLEQFRADLSALRDDVENCVSDARRHIHSDRGWDDYGTYRDDALRNRESLPSRIDAMIDMIDASPKGE